MIQINWIDSFVIKISSFVFVLFLSKFIQTNNYPIILSILSSWTNDWQIVKIFFSSLNHNYKTVMGFSIVDESKSASRFTKIHIFRNLFIHYVCGYRNFIVKKVLIHICGFENYISSGRRVIDLENCYRNGCFSVRRGLLQYDMFSLERCESSLI